MILVRRDEETFASSSSNAPVDRLSREKLLEILLSLKKNGKCNELEFLSKSAKICKSDSSHFVGDISQKKNAEDFVQIA